MVKCLIARAWRPLARLERRSDRNTLRLVTIAGNFGDDVAGAAAGLGAVMAFPI